MEERKKIYIGIDPSLDGTGICIIDLNYEIIHTEKLSTPTFGVERLFHLENKLLSILEHYPELSYASIESGAFRETGRLFDLGEWSGVIKLNLFKQNVPIIKVAPLQLKKYISGVGKNLGKETIMLDIYKHYGLEIRDNDIADAYVLSRIAHDFSHSLKLEESLTTLSLKEYQKDVLKKLKKTWGESDENKGIIL